MFDRRSLAAAALLAFTLGGCAVDPATAPGGLAGTWVEPIPGMPDEWQGFALHEDGTAESINMATLDYQRWRREADALILSGSSIGNGATIEIEERYRAQLEGDRLELIAEDGQLRAYERR
jgi:nitrogen regulatory protein PII-like uncharacterized protein